MEFPTNEDARRSATAFVGRLTTSIDGYLGQRLCGAYLIGSLAHGGFTRRYSDVDMALIVDAGLPPADLDEIQRMAHRDTPTWADKLSIFWMDRTFSAGRFPPLDRVDFLDHAIAIIERERLKPPRPSIAEIRSYLGDAPFANWAAAAVQFAGQADLAPTHRKSYLRALVYPARFIFSWRMGRMASNDEAVAALSQDVPPGLDIEVIQQALECRRAGDDPDGLFARRAALLAQVQACQREIARTADE